MKVAILLTCFNRKEKTLRCLESIFNLHKEQNIFIKVYLTNDNCTDGTPDEVKQKFPEVHIINGNGKLFWNRGMFMAWEEASKKEPDFYLWLNDDTYVYNNMLEILLNLSHKYNDQAIIVGATQSTDHQTTTYGGRLLDGSIPTPKGVSVSVAYFNGNIVLIPQYVFKIIGNLDYYFTHSKGDYDYGLRAREKGISIYQAGEYLGECNKHETLDNWCNPNIPLRKRWKALHLPNGMPPKETFHLEKRHFGIYPAIFHFFTIYLRCLCPSIWTKRYQT